MSTLFRIENRNFYIRPSTGRKIYPVEFACFPNEADARIAQEIREEINCQNKRKTYSWTQSLGIALFKYNQYAGGRLMVLPNVELDIVTLAMKNETGHLNSYCFPYNIYPNGQLIAFAPNVRLAIDNYIIRVSDNERLVTYLKEYTDVGIKARISPERDKEVIIRDNFRLSSYWIIDGVNLDAVYILYALQLKYNFLLKKSVLQFFVVSIQQYIVADDLKWALIQIAYYLTGEALTIGEAENLNFALESLKKHNNQAGRLNSYCTGLRIALEIIEGTKSLHVICRETMYCIKTHVVPLLWWAFWYGWLHGKQPCGYDR